MAASKLCAKREVKLYLAEWRKHRGLTQQQLAERLGCEVMTVSRWELHKIAVTTDTLAALAEALGDDLEPLDSYPSDCRQNDSEIVEPRY
jgi:transcriptional regulator with XRE-family HTH domain